MQPKARKLLILASIALLVLVALCSCGTAGPGAEDKAGTGGTPELQGKRKPDVSQHVPIALSNSEKLKVAATTNIVGDVVANVGGDQIDLTVLMGIGVDPHSYVPNPADTAAIHDAHVVFASGAGLETNLEEMLDSAGGEALHIYVSEGGALRAPPGGAKEGEATPSAEQDETGHAHDAVDPHVWFSVPNVIHWAERIHQTLSTLDRRNAGMYRENAEAYIQELGELDAWIEQQVAQIPDENRKLVTNHPSFGYFADRYGLEQVGAVYPLSPSAEPSAQEIAALQDAIRGFGVPAVFTESTVNPRLAEQVAQDTGVKLVSLYTGSLSGPGGGAESYIELMRYDVNAIVEALR